MVILMAEFCSLNHVQLNYKVWSICSAESMVMCKCIRQFQLIYTHNGMSVCRL